MSPSDELKELTQQLTRIEREVRALRARMAALENLPAAMEQTPQEIAPTPEAPPRARIPHRERVEQIFTHLREAQPESQPPAAASVPSPEDSPSLPPYEPPSRPFAESSSPWPEKTLEWKPLLRRLKILPPADSNMSIELLIGMWWVPRIAVLLLVIGLVFFGIYISRFTRPPLRFAEVLAASLGVCAAGFALERKNYKDLGSALFASGLSLVFFSIFAGYAVKAMHVIDSPAVAVALQMIVVVLIIICALWRNSEMIGTLATFLGYIACYFSFMQQLHGYALVAAFLLGIAGIALYLLRSWTMPYQVAVPGSYIIYGSILSLHWMIQPQRKPPFVTLLSFPFASMTAFAATDLFAYLRGCPMKPLQRREVQILNTALAILLGYIATRALYPAQLSSFYFPFGAVLLAGAIAFWFLHSTDAVMQSYLVKGSALIALGIIAYFGGSARWLALLAQAYVLLFSARRSKLRIVEIASVAVWYASLGWFLHWFFKIGALHTTFSREGLFSLFFLAASALLLALQDRWLHPITTATEDMLTDSVSPRAFFSGVNGLLVAGVAVVLGFGIVGQANYFPLYAVIYAALLAGIGCLRNRQRFLSSATVLIVGIVVFFLMYEDTKQLPRLWTNGAAIFADIAALLFFAQRKAARADSAQSLPHLIWLHLVWLTILHFCYAKSFASPSHAWLADALTVLALIGASAFLPAMALADAAFWPLALVCIELAARKNVANHYADVAFGFIWAMLFLIPFACAIVFRTWPRLRQKLLLLGEHERYQWMHLIIATAVALLLMHVLLSRQMLEYCMAALAIGLLMLRVWPQFISSPAIALSTLALAHLSFYGRLNHHGLANDLVVYDVITAAITLAFPLLFRGIVPEFSAQSKTRLQWLLSLAALAMADLRFLQMHGEAANYITIFWGLAACCIFLTGLSAGMKPLRIVGLFGLALCMPRLFVVDIRSTLYRIAAFIVLCMVLMGVAFLYAKFRPVLERTDHTETE